MNTDRGSCQNLVRCLERWIELSRQQSLSSWSNLVQPHADYASMLKQILMTKFPPGNFTSLSKGSHQITETGKRGTLSHFRESTIITNYLCRFVMVSCISNWLLVASSLLLQVYGPCLKLDIGWYCLKFWPLNWLEQYCLKWDSENLPLMLCMMDDGAG